LSGDQRGGDEETLAVMRLGYGGMEVWNDHIDIVEIGNEEFVVAAFLNYSGAPSVRHVADDFDQVRQRRAVGI
jgi:hypothetical protein